MELLGGCFMLSMKIHMPLGKGALQSHQTVPLLSREYDAKVRVHWLVCRGACYRRNGGCCTESAIVPQGAC